MIPVHNHPIVCHGETANSSICSGKFMQLGTNLGKVEYWSGGLPFCNIFKSGQVSGALPTGGTEHPFGHGYWSDIGTGRLGYVVMAAGENMPVGDWTLRYTGTCNPWVQGMPDGTVIGDKTGTGTKDDPWQRIYTNTSPVNTKSVFVYMENGSITPDYPLALIVPGEVERHDAGHIMRSLWVKDLQGSAMARTMDWQETNYSALTNYEDWPHFDDINWQSFATKGGTTKDGGKMGVPIKVCALAVMEMNTDWWANIPHQAVPAAIGSMYTEMDGLLSPEWKAKHCVINELSNEAHFNFEQRTWYECYSEELVCPTFDPKLDIFTLAGHKFNHGDRVSSFSNLYQQERGLTKGNTLSVFKHSDDTFSLSAGDHAEWGGRAEILKIVSVSQSYPAKITVNSLLPDTMATGTRVNFRGIQKGTTELNSFVRQQITKVSANSFTIDVDATGFTASVAFDGYVHAHRQFNSKAALSIRMKRNNRESPHLNHARASVIAWDAAKAAAPNLRILNAAGGQVNGGAHWLEKSAALVPGWANKIDILAWAPYWDLKRMTKANGFEFNWWEDLERATTAYINNLKGRTNEHELRVAKALGKYCIWAYECGDHNGMLSDGPQKDAMIELAISPLSAAIQAHYCRYYRRKGYIGMAYYMSHGGYRYGGATWGSQRFAGDVENGEYSSLKPFYNAGGVPTLNIGIE